MGMMLSPLVQAGALQNSQSPVVAEGDGDGASMEPLAVPPLVKIAHFPKVNDSQRTPMTRFSLKGPAGGRPISS
jgi:hypothetical protein